MWLPDGIYESMPATCVIIGVGGLFLSSFHVVAVVSALTLFAAAAVIRQMRRDCRGEPNGPKPSSRASVRTGSSHPQG